MRVLVQWLVFTVLLTAQSTELVPPPYLSKQYDAPPNAPASIVVAGKSEPGERLIVTGRALDVMRPVPGVSLYVFHTDLKGQYATGVNNLDAELNPRLHGVLRTDGDGWYQYETIRPGSYNNNPAHVHYVVKAPGYKPRMFDLWFEDDPVITARLKAGTSVYGTIPPKNHSWIAIRPVTRDSKGVWHTTRDLEMVKE